MSRDSFRNLGLLFLRLTAGVFLMSHGAQKVGKIVDGSIYAPDFQFWPDLGLGPQRAFMGLAASEFLFAGLVVIGLATRLAALPVVFSMCVAAFVFHAQAGQTPFNEGEKALLYAIIFSTLVMTGAGRYSVDGAIGRWRQNRKHVIPGRTESGRRVALKPA
ncbi:MAG: DoxX family protein [Planctomycetes bacterium]|nr:DoxX family protein [Planctomycetota bacterium]